MGMGKEKKNKIFIPEFDDFKGKQKLDAHI